MNGNGTNVHHDAPIELKSGKICPLMSGALVPVPPSPGKIAKPNQIDLAPIMVPCQKEHCQWWDDEMDECGIVGSLKRIGDLMFAERCG